jgi:hypothetical protein
VVQKLHREQKLLREAVDERVVRAVNAFERKSGSDSDKRHPERLATATGSLFTQQDVGHDQALYLSVFPLTFFDFLLLSEFS